MKIPVNFLWCNEQVNHLPEGKLKIHLLKVAELPDEFIPLSCRRKTSISSNVRQHGKIPSNLYSCVFHKVHCTWDWPVMAKERDLGERRDARSDWIPNSPCNLLGWSYSCTSCAQLFKGKLHTKILWSFCEMLWRFSLSPTQFFVNQFVVNTTRRLQVKRQKMNTCHLWKSASI